ncbi:glycoside hydrolase superfamily [Cladochytrium replicatum]|nr:glycoside hydrolase superfamily [Cladochytrium replicatum]
MAAWSSLAAVLLASPLFSTAALLKPQTTISDINNLLFGFAASGYQTEGAINADGRGDSVWEPFFNSSLNKAGFISPTVADDHYHRYKEDLAYLKKLNAKAYRFSIQWTRIFPQCNGTVNDKGLAFYDSMIDEIRKNGAEPIATLYHWDMPQACQSSYGGWLSRQSVDDFTAYALTVYKQYGNRVKYWMTHNEPNSICDFGYGQGNFAPGVTGSMFVCSHNVILSAGYAAKAMRDYARSQGWTFQISLPMVSTVGVPVTDSDADVKAAYTSNVYQAGLFIDPLVFGDYPDILKNDTSGVGGSLGKFTDADKAVLAGAIDYVAMNYYTAIYIKADNAQARGYSGSLNGPDGKPIGPTTGTSWHIAYPPGIRWMLKWIGSRYPGKDVWVSEIGVAVPNEATLTLPEIVNDTYRIDYLQTHLDQIAVAISNDSVPVKVVLAWSLLDNWEWQYAYVPKFGVINVDFNTTDLTRTVKDSAKFLGQYFKNSISPLNSLTTSSTSPSPKSGADRIGSVVFGNFVGAVMLRALGFGSIIAAMLLL